ncbi:MAG TPA: Hsp70 family protein [Aeromicrobium sp.]|nr:Hsp70 family protein [Aeromicrobium sp.]
MSYGLGIDVGTTYTAAAVIRDGQVHALTLGQNSDAMPTTVYLGDNGEFLVGDVARRRLIENPLGGAREFKRRLGDSTPLVLSGAPYSADRLMGVMIRHVVKAATQAEGEPPAHVVVTHPSNWQAFKIDLLRQAAVAAAAPAPVSLLEEPVAAAIYYAHSGRINVGELVGVYDLGGGTFDAAVLQRTDEGFRRLGEPAGIERLGGIDFDAALLAHVRHTLGADFDALDNDDRAVRVGMEDLRVDCIEAKQALSSDTTASINVGLPGLHESVRITRGEFERLIRPVLTETIDSLRTALRLAGATPDQLAAVLLIGGSSRIPLVADVVGAEIGRPVAVDAHPKLSVAMGAAVASEHELARGAAPAVLPAAAAAAATADAEPAAAEAATLTTIAPLDVPEQRSSGPNRKVLIGVGAAVAALALAGAGWFAYAQTSHDQKPTAVPTKAAQKPFVEIGDVELDGDRYRVDYQVTGFKPSYNGEDSKHIHFFLDTTDPENAGVGGGDAGTWSMTDNSSTFLTKFTYKDRDGAKRMCAVVVGSNHQVVSTDSGNCSELPKDPAPVRTVAPINRRPIQHHQNKDNSDSDSDSSPTPTPTWDSDGSGNVDPGTDPGSCDPDVQVCGF